MVIYDASFRNVLKNQLMARVCEAILGTVSLPAKGNLPGCRGDPINRRS
jgi:hypothetical protein